MWKNYKKQDTLNKCPVFLFTFAKRNIVLNCCLFTNNFATKTLC